MTENLFDLLPHTLLDTIFSSFVDNSAIFFSTRASCKRFRVNISDCRSFECIKVLRKEEDVCRAAKISRGWRWRALNERLYNIALLRGLRVKSVLSEKEYQSQCERLLRLIEQEEVALTEEFLESLHEFGNKNIVIDCQPDPEYKLGSEHPVWVCCPLNSAVQLGNISLVSSLLAAGASLRKPNCMAAIEIAVKYDFVGIVEALLLAGESVETVELESTRTMLFTAVHSGSFHVLPMLLQYGAKIDQMNMEGYTPLLVASKLGQFDIVKILLQHGAKLLPDPKGRSCLSHASAEGNTSTAEALLDAGDPIDSVCKNGDTPLMLAASRTTASTCRLLLQRGARFDLTNAGGSTPLSIACQHGAHDSVIALLEAGASITELHDRGGSLLLLAAERGKAALLSALINASVNVNYVNYRGRNAVMLAALNKNNIALQLLLAAGASLDCVDKDGDNALILAAEVGCPVIVSILMEAGASYDFVNQRGKTAMECAIDRGKLPVLRYLVPSRPPLDTGHTTTTQTSTTTAPTLPNTC